MPASWPRTARSLRALDQRLRQYADVVAKTALLVEGPRAVITRQHTEPHQARPMRARERLRFGDEQSPKAMAPVLCFYKEVLKPGECRRIVRRLSLCGSDDAREAGDRSAAV